VRLRRTVDIAQRRSVDGHDGAALHRATVTVTATHEVAGCDHVHTNHVMSGMNDRSSSRYMITVPSLATAQQSPRW
jgi:hypothetical protein